MAKEILFLHDGAGQLQAVQISPDLWELLKPHLPPDLNGGKLGNRGENDYEAFTEFLQSWNFPYSYEPAVTCPSCQTMTPDWREDEKFNLTNANIGGVLVFHCRNCGATVRQKYFKNHMSCDFTPPGP